MKKVVDFKKEKTIKKLYAKFKENKKLYRARQLELAIIKNTLKSLEKEIWSYVSDKLKIDANKCLIKDDGIYQASYEDSIDELRPWMDSFKKIFKINNDEFAYNVVKEFLRDNMASVYALLRGFVDNNEVKGKLSNVVKFPTKRE